MVIKNRMQGKIILKISFLISENIPYSAKIWKFIIDIKCIELTAPKNNGF